MVIAMPNLEIVNNMVRVHEVDEQAYQNFKREYLSDD